MEVKVLREKAGELELEITGEDHTLFNVLRDHLVEDKEVLKATYRMDHPLHPNYFLYLKTVEKKVPRSMERKVGLQEVPGIGPKKAEQLNGAGVKTANDLARAKLAELAEKTGISEKVLAKHAADAKEMVGEGTSYARMVLKRSLKSLGKEFKDLGKML
ncbi:MAG: hypothetical protein GXO65_06100 [Euryarchaeota archaeon]|nr:hypothetical protein [Euryarchaeota archaeon]